MKIIFYNYLKDKDNTFVFIPTVVFRNQHIVHQKEYAINVIWLIFELSLQWIKDIKT